MSYAARLTRRQCLLYAAAVVASGATVACGPSHPAAARLQASPKRTLLVWQPWRATWQSGWGKIFYELTAPFRNANPDIDIKVSAPTSASDIGLVASQILAGTGPDVFSGFGFPPTAFIDSGLLLDLSSFIKSNGIDLSIFDTAQLAAYRSAGNLYALPAVLTTSALAVNLGLLDNLGYPRPAPGWTYTEAETLWHSTTRRSFTSPRTGVTFDLIGGSFPGPEYWEGWGASIIDPTNPSICGLSSTAATRFADWYWPLFTAGVIGSGTSPTNVLASQLQSGLVVMQEVGTAILASLATELQGLVYDFYPWPAWPTGTTSGAGLDFYAISTRTQHPQEAFRFLQWLTAEPVWPRTVLRLQFALPALRSLWEEWAQVVPQVAPPFQGKNLHAFLTAALENRAYPLAAWQYSTGTTWATLVSAGNQINSQNVSPVLGLNSLTHQIDAIQAAAATAAKAG